MLRMLKASAGEISKDKLTWSVCTCWSEFKVGSTWNYNHTAGELKPDRGKEEF